LDTRKGALNGGRGDQTNLTSTVWTQYAGPPHTIPGAVRSTLGFHRGIPVTTAGETPIRAVPLEAKWRW